VQKKTPGKPGVFYRLSIDIFWTHQRAANKKGGFYTAFL